jgi:hypothetical protein
VHLTPKAHAALPFIEAEWQATGRAVAALDAELPMPLEDLLKAVAEALERRPFRERLAHAGLAATGQRRRAENSSRT